jgi:hypothetical protein
MINDELNWHHLFLTAYNGSKCMHGKHGRATSQVRPAPLLQQRAWRTRWDLPTTAYEIRTEASVWTIETRWVFSSRGFMDEDGDSLVAGNSLMVLFSILQQLGRVCWGWSFSGAVRRWGWAPEDLPVVLPYITTLGTAVPMPKQGHVRTAAGKRYRRRQPLTTSSATGERWWDSPGCWPWHAYI